MYGTTEKCKWLRYHLQDPISMKNKFDWVRIRCSFKSSYVYQKCKCEELKLWMELKFTFTSHNRSIYYLWQYAQLSWASCTFYVNSWVLTSSQNLNAILLTEYIAVLFSRKALKMNQTCFSTFHCVIYLGCFYILRIVLMLEFQPATC